MESRRRTAEREEIPATLIGGRNSESCLSQQPHEQANASGSRTAPTHTDRPPRTQGARADRVSAAAGGWLIPACAGSISPPSASAIFSGAHPRVRGEHAGLGHEVHGDRGSSPRARGASKRPRAGVLVAGLIPACAGSIVTISRSMRSTGAHPRVRGEHGDWIIRGVQGKGSSPRARGAWPHVPHQPGSAGLIPACAGSIKHL